MKAETYNRSRGIAIGVVLMAVVLITAIMAMMAQVTGGSTGTSKKQQNRVTAASVIAQMNAIKSGIKTAINSRSEARYIRLARTAAGCTAGTEMCLYDPAHEIMDEPIFNPQIFAAGSGASGNPIYSAQGRAWPGGSGGYSFIQSGGSDLGTSAPEDIIALFDIDDDVCRNINNILHQIPFNNSNAPNPIDATFVNVNEATPYVAGTVTLAAASDEADGKLEGCFGNGTINVYILIVKAR